MTLTIHAGWHREDGSTEDTLSDLEAQHGPCPTGQARVAFRHPCGHATAVQVDSGDREYLDSLLRPVAEAPCLPCLRAEPVVDSDPKAAQEPTPISPGSPRGRGEPQARATIQDSGGNDYDLY